MKFIDINGSIVNLEHIRCVYFDDKRRTIDVGYTYVSNTGTHTCDTKEDYQRIKSELEQILLER